MAFGNRHNPPLWPVHGSRVIGWPGKILWPGYRQSSNSEMLGLAAGLQAREEKLPVVTTPIFYLQRKQAVLLPAVSVDYFRQHKLHGVKYSIIAARNHFIPGQVRTWLTMRFWAR